jgi:hypothetical protein
VARPRKRRELGQPRFVLQSQSLNELAYQISRPSHAFDTVVRGAIDSMSGVFETTRRTGCVFAISRRCAGNPASPQSVPASVLLNFFMPAPDRRAPGAPLPPLCNVITSVNRQEPALASIKFDPNEIWAAR